MRPEEYLTSLLVNRLHCDFPMVKWAEGVARGEKDVRVYHNLCVFGGWGGGCNLKRASRCSFRFAEDSAFIIITVEPSHDGMGMLWEEDRGGSGGRQQSQSVNNKCMAVL